MPPANINRLDTPLFLKDPGMNFVRTFFGKLDFELIWTLACVMTCFNLWKVTPIEGGLVFYTYYKLLLYWPRKFFGTRNLAQKTLTEN